MANILVADDHKSVRTSLRKILENNNHKVMEAEDGVEAIEVLQENDIDLLVMDIYMNNKGGIETLLDLSVTRSGLNVILITGIPKTDSEAFTNLISHLGAKHILYKPFKKSEIIEAVNDVLKINAS